MLIDPFEQSLFDELASRSNDIEPTRRHYLLVDGAFVPGLHRMLRDDQKAMLFASLPGCNEETKDVSPFLVPYDPCDKKQAALMRRCSGWPMVSLIKTTESLEQLSARLAAWCVVEADGQRFNFRFPDTRRLPAIFAVLHSGQRAQLAGPAVRWSYVARDGRWADLPVDGNGSDIAADPVLDAAQFATLVDDSRADEVLAILDGRGHETSVHPSKSHLLVSAALKAAVKARLDDHDLLDWCAWFWENDQLQDEAKAAELLESWRTSVS